MFGVPEVSVPRLQHCTERSPASFAQATSGSCRHLHVHWAAEFLAQERLWLVDQLSPGSLEAAQRILDASANFGGQF